MKQPVCIVKQPVYYVFPLLRRLAAGEQRTAAAFPILGDILEIIAYLAQKPQRISGRDSF